MEISARNQLPGKVISVKTGAIMAEVVIEVNGPVTITAEVTKGSVERLGIAEGDMVAAIVKATEVMIAK
jgi:molybdopterin-binding protein